MVGFHLHGFLDQRYALVKHILLDRAEDAPQGGKGLRPSKKIWPEVGRFYFREMADFCHQMPEIQ